MDLTQLPIYIGTLQQRFEAIRLVLWLLLLLQSIVTSSGRPGALLRHRVRGRRVPAAGATRVVVALQQPTVMRMMLQLLMLQRMLLLLLLLLLLMEMVLMVVSPEHRMVVVIVVVVLVVLGLDVMLVVMVVVDERTEIIYLIDLFYDDIIMKPAQMAYRLPQVLLESTGSAD
uniref:Uncharacterized protein n=1 Tax=Anopheles farauti TaxID=69004 RepID=A0A182Q713_9DIPT